MLKVLRVVIAALLVVAAATMLTAITLLALFGSR